MQMCVKVTWGVGTWARKGRPTQGNLLGAAHELWRECLVRGKELEDFHSSVTGYESLGGGRKFERTYEFPGASGCLYGQAMWLQLLGSSLPTERCRCWCRCWLLEMEAYRMSSVWTVCPEMAIVLMGYSGARTTSDLYYGHTGLHGINLQMNYIYNNCYTAWERKKVCWAQKHAVSSLYYRSYTLSITKVIFWSSVLLLEYILISSEVRGLCDIIYWPSNLKKIIMANIYQVLRVRNKFKHCAGTILLHLSAAWWCRPCSRFPLVEAELQGVNYLAQGHTALSHGAGSEHKTSLGYKVYILNH